MNRQLFLIIVLIGNVSTISSFANAQSNSGNQIAYVNITSNCEIGSPFNGCAVKNTQFEPSQLKIKKGTTVIWTNEDDVIHTVTSDDPGNPGNTFNSDYLTKGDKFQVKFNESGIYNYFDSQNPVVKGLIAVSKESTTQ